MMSTVTILGRFMLLGKPAVLAILPVEQIKGLATLHVDGFARAMFTPMQNANKEIISTKGRKKKQVKYDEETCVAMATPTVPVVFEVAVDEYALLQHPHMFEADLSHIWGEWILCFIVQKEHLTIEEQVQLEEYYYYGRSVWPRMDSKFFIDKYHRSPGLQKIIHELHFGHDRPYSTSYLAKMLTTVRATGETIKNGMSEKSFSRASSRKKNEQADPRIYRDPVPPVQYVLYHPSKEYDSDKVSWPDMSQPGGAP